MTVPHFSAVIPVFNSAATLEKVVDDVAVFFQSSGRSFEIILVNDGSRDGSWAIAEKLAKRLPFVTAIDLVRNFGQHPALFCGLRAARGDAVVMLDDDLQNPASEIEKLICKAAEGHDLVVGRYETKRHSFFRRLGSGMVQCLQERIFNKPRDFVLTNFRLAERAVVERALLLEGPKPYLPGLLLAASGSPANVLVQHRPSALPRSRYSFVKLLGLVGRLLFQYSTWPLRMMVLLGSGVALVSFVLGGIFLVRGLVHAAQVPGWTSIAVLLSFFCGFIILLLGILGEYLRYLVQRLNQPQPYFVRKIVRHDPV